MGNTSESRWRKRRPGWAAVGGGGPLPGAEPGPGTEPGPGVELGPESASPWPPGAAELLTELLVRFDHLAEQDDRTGLLRHMDAAAGPYTGDSVNFLYNVPRSRSARADLRAIVDFIEAGTDPTAGLDRLRAALHGGWPQDGGLPWIDVTVLALTGLAPLPAATTLDLVRALLPLGDRPLPEQPTNAQLFRHVPSTRGTKQLDGGQTLPEIVRHLCDLQGPADPAPLLRFLTGLATELTAYPQLSGLREWLAPFGPIARPAPTPVDTRLIVQIRIEPEGAPGRGPGAYTLSGAYYRQPVAGGPMGDGTPLPQTDGVSAGTLREVGTEQIPRWEALTKALRTGGGVRLEFLLPNALLEHPAETWLLGEARTQIGYNHPVVVRSLERYKDAFLNMKVWQQRWKRLCHEPDGRDALDRITWWGPEAEFAALAEQLMDEPELVSVGLAVSYERLSAADKALVHGAFYHGGLPALVWSRGEGDPGELLAALRKHPPARLRDLPEAVYQCRKRGWSKAAADVRNNIALLWEDPYCVDGWQDENFPGVPTYGGAR